MTSELVHIYGPISIQAYGVMIFIGVLIFLWRASQHPLRKKYLTEEQFFAMVTQGIICGIIGGKLLHIVSEAHEYATIWDIFKIWHGGFSILGAVMGIGLYMPIYLQRHKIALLPVLDLICIYAPLVQSISRIGCFFAGCCYGVQTQVPWAVTCDTQLVHPTQLYSAAALFIIFLMIRFVIYPYTKTKSGCVLGAYLILVGMERAVIDMWRADRIMISNILSYYQIIAAAISLVGVIIFLLCLRKK